jgi:desulfoferrodoxin (superoxide reductase-like protein)/DNA-directed RNA polymerase subunit RPC12/RpoP
MKYICTNCNYIFDEFLDNADDTIQKVNNDTQCPACNEYDVFQWIDEEVNYAKDINNLELHELEHIPQIESSKEEGIIKVFVWQLEHPMWPEHRLYSISLFDEYWDLVVEEFLPKDWIPEAEFDISDFDEYEIRSKCRVHW